MKFPGKIFRPQKQNLEQLQPLEVSKGVFPWAFFYCGAGLAQPTHQQPHLSAVGLKAKEHRGPISMLFLGSIGWQPFTATSRRGPFQESILAQKKKPGGESRQFPVVWLVAALRLESSMVGVEVVFGWWRSRTTGRSIFMGQHGGGEDYRPYFPLGVDLTTNKNGLLLAPEDRFAGCVLAFSCGVQTTKSRRSRGPLLKPAPTWRT